MKGVGSLNLGVVISLCSIYVGVGVGVGEVSGWWR